MDVTDERDGREQKKGWAGVRWGMVRCVKETRRGKGCGEAGRPMAGACVWRRGARAVGEQ
eukprot:scaffold9052_cov107-Isochrysis_galbana.AAC.5